MVWNAPGTDARTKQRLTRILIQEVVGRRVGDYFLPSFAGVAFSLNEFRWSPRIKREDGLIPLSISPIQGSITYVGERIAIRGGSNGGLLVGACLNQRPGLFGAGIAEVGVFDMLRFQKFTIGWAWVSDYGSSEDPDMFPVLHAYSPYHNLKNGVEYPAVMVPTADHDIIFELGGPGQIIGIGNGNPNSHECDRSHHRRVFCGLGQVIVQALAQEGTIRLHAQAPGLKGGMAKIAVIGV